MNSHQRRKERRLSRAFAVSLSNMADVAASAGRAFRAAAEAFAAMRFQYACKHEVWTIMQIDPDNTVHMRCSRCGTPRVQRVDTDGSSPDEPVQPVTLDTPKQHMVESRLH